MIHKYSIHSNKVQLQKFLKMRIFNHTSSIYDIQTTLSNKLWRLKIVNIQTEHTQNFTTRGGDEGAITLILSLLGDNWTEKVLALSCPLDVN